MARTSYDDWNFMGELQQDGKKPKSSRPAKIQRNSIQRYSFILLCTVILLTSMGLVCVYSASFETAVLEGYSHYHYLMRHALYIAVGVFLMVFVNVIPMVALKVLCPLSFFACMIALVVDLIAKGTSIVNSDTIGFLFLSGVMYLSLYFSGRGNKIERLSQLIAPLLGCIVVLALILLKRSISYALMFLALSLAMFASGGVGVFGAVLILLYIAVPVLCAILSSSEKILAVAAFLIPGLGQSPGADDAMTVRSAIASGSWWGKGLGGGAYKGSVINDIAGDNIIACICEELGFWGIAFIALLFVFLAFVGYKTAKSIRKANPFLSNMAIGVTTIMVWQFVLNIAWAVGLLSSDGLPMPFFSYGIGIIPVLLESGILYRATRTRIPAQENENVIETIQDELMFPERYDFEDI